MFEILTLHNILFATLFGGLIGLERERVIQLASKNNLPKNGHRNFAGIRTFILIAVWGLIVSSFVPLWGDLVVFVGFGALIALLLSAHVYSAFRLSVGSILTELDALITFFIGVLVGAGALTTALSLTVVIALVSALRHPLHHLAEVIQDHEFLSTLKFATIAVLILPLLPNQDFDAQIFGVLGLGTSKLAGGLAIFNPYNIWLMVVVISAISFIGYFLTKFFGTKGIELSGAVGGLYSSTTTCLSLAEKSKTKSRIRAPFLSAFFFAYAAMIPRALLEISSLNSDFFRHAIKPVSLFLAGVLALAFYFYQRGKQEEKFQHFVRTENPFRLSSAILMAFFIVLVLALAKIILAYFDPQLIYLLAIVLGLSKMDPLVVALAAIVGTEISANTGTATLLVGMLANGFQKTASLYFFGNHVLIKNWLAGIGALVIFTFVILKFLA